MNRLICLDCKGRGDFNAGGPRHAQCRQAGHAIIPLSEHIRIIHEQCRLEGLIA